MNSNFTRYGLCLLIAACGATLYGEAKAPYELRQANHQTYDFEEAQVPAEFTAGKNSKLSIADNYFKGGNKSLRWDWSSDDAEIFFTSKDAFRSLTGENPDPIVYEWVTFCDLSSFSTWIFSEKVLGGALRFNIGDSNFYYNMNFTNWSPLSLMYGRDLTKFPAYDSEVMRIRPPKGVKSGTIYFDLFSPRQELDVRAVRTTNRQPYVANKELGSEEIVYKEAEKNESGFSVAIFKNDANQVEIDSPKILDATQKAEIQKVVDEFLTPYIKSPPVSERDIPRLEGIRKRLNLSRNGEIMNGQLGNPQQFYSDLELVARAIKTTKLSEAERAKYRELAIDMVDLLIQQGHGSFYALRTYFITPMLNLRDELKAANRWGAVIERLRFIAGMSEIYLQKPYGNADFYNTLLLSCVGVSLIDDRDEAQQYRDMLAIKHFLNTTTTHGEMAPDGTFYHHNMVYSGYSFPAMGPICQVLYLTRGTPFFAESMYDLASKTLLMMSYYSNPYAPNMFSGRHRNHQQFDWGFTNNLQLLAKAVTPLDKEFAARYLYFANLHKKSSPIVKEFEAQGIKPAKMEGSLALNYAVSLIHRNKNAVAIVRGQRDGMFANEAYANQGANTMGRYVNFGQLQVIVDTPEKSGFVLNKGFDFNYYPGTTARVIGHDALRQHFENIEALTTEYFAGATALDGVGLWAMKLQEELPEVGDALRVGPPLYYLGQKEYKKRCQDSRYDVTFRAQKSMFMFDNVIVAMGSDIKADDKTAPIATTLAQNSLDKVDGSKYQKFEDYLIDSVGNGFYFPNQNVVINRGVVEKPFNINWRPHMPELHDAVEKNVGNMELIYIDHGNGGEKSREYLYYQMIRPTANELKDFVTKQATKNDKIVEILQQDSSAHILKYNPKNIYGYALFSAGKVNFGDLKSVDKPAIILVKNNDNKELELSVFNPFFDELTKHMSFQRDVRTVVDLGTNWQLVDTNNPLVKSLGNGKFEVINKDLTPTIFKLKK